jgi:aryl-phospho-beta-D-glucosidase BglC (GH1 family)
MIQQDKLLQDSRKGLKNIIWKGKEVWEDFWNDKGIPRRSSWLQIQKSGFNSRRYQIFWEVVRLERGPLSLVSRTEDTWKKK